MSLLPFHRQHPIQLKDAVIAPQAALLRASKPLNIDSYAANIQQSWGFRDCAPVLSTSRHTSLVTEMISRTLPALDRVHLFHGVLQAVIELTKPIALVCKHAQQFVQPQAYLDHAGDVPIICLTLRR